MHMQQTSVPGQGGPNDRALARGGLARWGLASGRPAIESVKKTGALIVGTWFADSALCCSVSPAEGQSSRGSAQRLVSSSDGQPADAQPKPKNFCKNVQKPEKS